MSNLSTVHVMICVYVCVVSLHLCCSRCLIFRQHAVKMSHLLTVHVMICVYVCVVSLHLCCSRCLIFRQHAVKMSHLSTVHVIICVCVCVANLHLRCSTCLFFRRSCHIFVCTTTNSTEAVHRFYESRRRLFNDDRPLQVKEIQRTIY